MRGRTRLAAAVALAAAALVLPSCGYALLGRGTVVDPSIKRIGVPPFQDDTGRPGLDQKVTEAVIDELLKRGRFDVVPRREDVDAVVDGRLLRYQVQPVGFAGTGSETQADRYAIILTASVRYSKLGVTEPIWSNDRFSFRDEYDVGGDPQAFFDREDQAIDRMATEFARSLVQAMLEAF